MVLNGTVTQQQPLHVTLRALLDVHAPPALTGTDERGFVHIGSDFDFMHNDMEGDGGIH